MKSIVGFSLILVPIFAYDPALVEECLKETKVNRENVKEYLNSMVIPEDNEDVHLFAPCYGRKIGGLKENGELDWDFVSTHGYELLQGLADRNPNFEPLRKVSREKVRRVFEHCRKQVFEGKHAGHKLAKAHNCIFRKLLAKDFE